MGGTKLVNNLCSAPFDDRKAGTIGGSQFLSGYFYKAVGGLPSHKYPDQGIGGRGDFQRGGIGIGICLEGNDVVGVDFHHGEPINDELISLPTVQAQLRQGVFQKYSGIFALNTEAFR